MLVKELCTQVENTTRKVNICARVCVGVIGKGFRFPALPCYVSELPLRYLNNVQYAG